MRNLQIKDHGAWLLILLITMNAPALAESDKVDKPSRTLIGGNPWVPTPAPAEPKVIYGTDDRIDLYEETDPDRLTWAASTCGLFNASSLQSNGGTYTIRTSTYDVCEEEPFSNQPTAAFCSGFMVGEDIIATAGHCYDASDLSGTRFVFGFAMADANTPVLTVTEDQVYTGVEILGRALSGGLDYAIIRVDRPIVSPGAEAFDIRREGVIAVTASVGVIGHPSGLPLKIAFGASTIVRDNSNSGFFVANLDTYQGNSGSPVIDPFTGTIEGILVRGEQDFITVGNCSVSNVVSNSGGRGEDVSKSTSFMQFIPELVSTNGAVSLDQDRYGCDDEMIISLTDTDLANQANAEVEVVSSGGDSETVTLASVSDDGEFSGSIPVVLGAVAVENGTLNVAEGNVLTVSYADATHSEDAPDVVTVDAPVDCTAPAVTNVVITQIGARFATVTFDTSEPTSGTVRAGETCGTSNAQASFASGTSHSVFVSNLLPLSEYFVSIEATDGAGNSVAADNEGDCFRFATDETTEYYTQIFASQVSDLANSSVLFTPEEGGGFTVCHDPISELPVASADSTNLFLTDDGFDEVLLSDGAVFPFYGAEYDRVFVNANGNVTFESGDSNFDPSTADHFSSVRIAPYFTDLEPSAGGSVWYRQLGNRLVITWQSVPHYDYNGLNTIQLELFFDGSIRFSYRALVGLPTITGLSAGQGMLSDFVSMDLSAQPSCGASTERFHSGDTDRDHLISLQETLRVIQFFNLEGYHCDVSSEDGFAPGPGAETCTPHDTDYNPQDWNTSMSEVLRLVQIYNSSGYQYDPEAGTEDGFVPLNSAR